jgi:Ca2+-binding EF-hand superfamily protein
VTHRILLRMMAGPFLALLVQGTLQAANGDPPANDIIAKYDSDKDQTLSLDEVKAAASTHFDKLDKDSDKTLAANEVKGVLGAGAFKTADTDKDGTLSRDEYLALVEKLFKRADTNHDGTLDAKELRTKSGAALRRLIN